MARNDGQTHRRTEIRVASLVAGIGLALLGFGCPSEPSPGEDESESSSSGADPLCTPGMAEVCPCVGGGAGVQTCNPQGTGFDPCICTGTTIGTTTTTDSSTDDTSDGEVSTSTDDDTGTTEDSTTSSSSSEAESTTGEEIPAYGPCFGGDLDCMVAGEICVGTGGATPSTVCMLQDCDDAADCSPTPDGAAAVPQCDDVTGDGVSDCYLLCEVDGDCPTGMVCFLAAGPTCIWPPP